MARITFTFEDMPDGTVRKNYAIDPPQDKEDIRTIGERSAAFRESDKYFGAILHDSFHGTNIIKKNIKEEIDAEKDDELVHEDEYIKELLRRE